MIAGLLLPVPYRVSLTVTLTVRAMLSTILPLPPADCSAMREHAAGAVPGAASVSNDGYSVTFGSNASVTAATRQEAYEIIRTALGSDPHDLLYRGIL